VGCCVTNGDVVEVDFWNCSQKTKDDGSQRHTTSPRLVYIIPQSAVSDALRAGLNMLLPHVTASTHPRRSLCMPQTSYASQKQNMSLHRYCSFFLPSENTNREVLNEHVPSGSQHGSYCAVGCGQLLQAAVPCMQPSEE
jgi:hypothetical protein